MWIRFSAGCSADGTRSCIVQIRLCATAFWDDLSVMRKSAFAAFLLAAALAFAWGPGAAGFAQFSGAGWGWPDNLARASLLGRGMLPALLFGCSFAGLLLVLIAAGCIGMASNAPPKTPKPNRSRRKKEASTPDHLHAV